MKANAAARKMPGRFNRSGNAVDVIADEFMNQRAPTELTVERIPALVREVDALMQILMTASLTTGSREALEASDELVQRADDVDAFCQSLRPGPLQEIVSKQATRLREAAHHLQLPSSRLNAQIVSLSVDKPRTRPVPIRVTPFIGSALVRAAAKLGVNTKKHQGANSVRKVAKPLYRWEKRRFLRGSTVTQPNVAGSKATAGRTPQLAQKYHDNEMELHPCSEPGHYSHLSIDKVSSSTATANSFEFQLILTEDEFKALKFQRRRLQAEQRHLSRRNKPTPSTLIRLAAPMAASPGSKILSNKSSRHGTLQRRYRLGQGTEVK